MQTTWVIAADASRARIFEVSGDDKNIQEIDDLTNPQGRLADHEIDRDSKGRYFGKGERDQAHTVEPAVDAREHQVQLFSKRLGHYLEQARSEHRFDRLWLIAPPKFLGLIRQDLSKQVQQAVDEEIPKDLAWFESHDIAEFVRQHPPH
jgi:protein required for attachment to host cells